MTLEQTIYARVQEIETILAAISVEVANYHELANAKVANWGHAGNLEKVKSDLQDIAAFLNITTSEN